MEDDPHRRDADRRSVFRHPCAAGADCVRTPAAGKGFSSYFAIEVTNPASPDLLWEFSDPALGFSTTGPAIVRINTLNTPTSVPLPRQVPERGLVRRVRLRTHRPDRQHFQFLGRSNQTLKLFIRNLKTGAEVQTIDTGIPNAFAGSMLNAAADYNLDYQDDVVYIPYVKKSGTTWTDGGVLRLVPRVSPTANSVTMGVVHRDRRYRSGDLLGRPPAEQPDQQRLALLRHRTVLLRSPPGAGSVTTPDIDDPVNQRKIFGIKEQCFASSGSVGSFDNSCTTALTLGQLDDVTNIANVKSEAVTNAYSYKGWYLSLDPAGTYTYDGIQRAFYPERVITDPLASTNGIVFLTAFKPYGDFCAIGGKSFLWVFRYNTGGAPTYGLLGKALLQVSTAAIEQLDLSTAFQGDTALHKGGRRSYAMEGVPPVSQGLSILSPPPPVKRIMHMMER